MVAPDIALRTARTRRTSGPYWACPEPGSRGTPRRRSPGRQSQYRIMFGFKGFVPRFRLYFPLFGQRERRRERITSRRQHNRSPVSSPVSLTNFIFHRWRTHKTFDSTIERINATEIPGIPLPGSIDVRYHRTALPFSTVKGRSDPILPTSHRRYRRPGGRLS